MPDEISPSPAESGDDATKNETIRITLPPKSDQAVVKRETVRINVPGKAVPPAGIAPKKETSKIPTLSGAPAAPSAPSAPAVPPAGGKSFVPPPGPPKPPGSPSLPGAKPLAGAMPPKPPALAGRPTVPLKPSPAPAAPAATTAPAPEPVTQRAASPKKETARITLPPEGSAKPSLPKATVKMQQTQPLTSRPSGMQAAPMITTQAAGALQSGVAADSAVTPLSIVALILSLAALVTVYLAYSASAAAL